MSEDARRIAADAAAARARLLQETREECARIVARGREDGDAEGAAQAAHLREELAQLEHRMLGEVEGEIVRTAVQVAKSVLSAEQQARPDLVVDVALAALHTTRTARDINIRVHPRDLPRLRAAKERLVAVLTRAKDLELREDRRVRPGGVLIETESGVVDAQLETQLEEISRVLGV